MADQSRFQVEDDRFRAEREKRPQPGIPMAAEPPRPRSALATCLTGCLIALVAMLVIAGLAMWWAWNNFRELASDIGAQTLKQAMNEAGLPPNEVDDMNVEIDRVAEAFKTKQISVEEMGELFERIVESPLMTTIAMSAIEMRYLDPSGLTDEEKAQARVTIQRFMRGAMDEKIGEAEIKQAMAPVTIVRRNGDIELRQQVTDEQLQAFLQQAKAEADAAEIPAEVAEVDPSDELKRIVDEALDRRALPPANGPEEEEPAAEGADAP